MPSAWIVLVGYTCGMEKKLSKEESTQLALIVGAFAFGGYAIGMFRSAFGTPASLGELVASLAVPSLFVAVLVGMHLASRQQQRRGSESEQQKPR